MSIANNLASIKATIPQGVCLVAVSKTKPQAAIIEAYEAGQRVFGENKAQELQEKAEALPKDIEWHMIGHLQRNKVKYIAPHVSLIHSVDSLRLLEEIDKRARQNKRTIPVLLQCYIAKEESKYGLDEIELDELLNSTSYRNLKNIEVHGLMGMATNTDNQLTVRKEFEHLKTIFENTKRNHFAQIESFNTISMGMSGDYQLAIETGSTMVRIGSSIFGARNY
ncbi:MAG: YggS family pyridoxal phosphate-dependent enzyme [Bacteroidetes bacterium]|nr:YggS family pyridoxal phosphate-dependent enzyme [Bacteroidota bacterium]NOG56769.1 YggS family pyridoxal phosphate-dependent enzyme [Bacteroidota bacterium]